MRIKHTEQEWRGFHSQAVRHVKDGGTIGKFLTDNNLSTGTFYSNLKALNLDYNFKDMKPGVVPTRGNKLMKFVPAETKTNGHYAYEVEFKGGTKLRFNDATQLSEIVRRLTNE